MEFTELCKQSSNHCAYSPNGQYLATVVGYRLVVRDVASLKAIQLYACNETIQQIAWSPDSLLILAASYKLGTFQVWRLDDPDWTATVSEGLAGLSRVQWMPDARHIWSISNHQLRSTVYSLVDGTTHPLPAPKTPTEGWALRCDGRYLAVCERQRSTDHLHLLDTTTWQTVHAFPCGTNDLRHLQWSPDGRYLAIWDGLFDPRVFVYLPTGQLVAEYAPDPCGAPETGRPRTGGLGIRTVAWAPSAQLLALGGYNGRVTLLNHYTWKPVAEWGHPKRLETSRETRDAVVYREIREPFRTMGYEIATLPLTMAAETSDDAVATPKSGVTRLAFSATGDYVLTSDGRLSQTLWIRRLVDVQLVAVVVQAQPILTAAWHPRQPDLLAFACGGGYVHLWKGETLGCELLEVPTTHFAVRKLAWSPDGASLLLMDKDKFCLAFPLNADALGGGVSPTLDCAGRPLESTFPSHAP
ncbi:hypothetical protein CXG81DRAFT_12185 [Caulochytrium protostelioides]|uniref:YVTN repeat-like/Quino protein amine dehydrogenase n=1 Tax=Caulochytrium protostelioides TaxID=1555241 RepID=A0A4P9WY74_9FUNG|nr:YVTN repeat-like/Quino protein amine dehydrogenase [Caulochytrium protostelioides]RKP01293.1 hypothetical protein CXG81DRAFT_12185 [Caulochytrium protostelioides]|eukprot:RKP01293.1 hypothetical protein CXG81DRAFT_12185 [Caulochytrium protostelioides]